MAETWQLRAGISKIKTFLVLQLEWRMPFSREQAAQGLPLLNLVGFEKMCSSLGQGHWWGPVAGTRLPSLLSRESGSASAVTFSGTSYKLEKHET